MAVFILLSDFRTASKENISNEYLAKSKYFGTEVVGLNFLD